MADFAEEEGYARDADGDDVVEESASASAYGDVI